MIVAITGGTGFIGRRLVRRHLGLGDEVRVLTRRPRPDAGLDGAVQAFSADLTDESAELRPFVDGADVLYHCAGEIRDENRMHSLHVDGTHRLLQAATGRAGRWVQLSSVGAYGFCRAGVVSEDTPPAPRGVYEQTKTESDRQVMAAVASGRLVASVLRPSTVFGPDMTNQSLFQMVSVINRGLFFFIGAPGASANYIHVANIVEALYRCATLPQAAGRVYNLSDWRSLEDFVGTIAEELGRPRPRLRLPELPVRLAARLFGRVPGMPISESRVNAMVNRVRYASDRIRQELGYEHKVTMEEGLRELVKAWRARHPARPGLIHAASVASER
jgi:nucleoside-diphosphate-sugar epimerase